jgi:glyoxylase-like metal-dependent hydrolase (beta-lactamase superfamily II)
MTKSSIILIFLLAKTICGFSQKPNYRVYALKFTSELKGPSSVIAVGGSATDSISLVFMFWLVKGDNGKNILVDAGFLKDVEDAKDFGLSYYIRPDSVLLRLGLKASDITDIILSHPHWDHMDGINLFPNAQVWVQKEDYNYFVGNAWQKDGRTAGFNKRDVLKLVELNLAGKLILVDGDDKEIIPGIKVYTGSRHTFNSQFVLVQSGANKIILASDNVYFYYNLEHLRPAPFPASFDTAAYVKSMQRMKTLASNFKFIIPGHDALMFKQFPTVAEGIIEIK